MLVAAAWASVTVLFGVRLRMETAKRTTLRKSITMLSVGVAFATGAYAAYFVLQR